MTDSGYPKIFQNKVSDAITANVGTYIFSRWEKNFPLIQLMKSFTQVSDVIAMSNMMYRNNNIANCKIQIQGLTLDSTPAPLLDTFDCGSRPQKLAFDVMKCNSRLYDSSLFTMGITGAQLLGRADGLSTYDMYLKGLHILTTENIPRFLWSEFISSLYADISEIDGNKPSTLTYDQFSAMPTVDLSTTGLTLDSIYQMQIDYTYKTESANGDPLVIIIDKTNFDTYLKSCKSTLSTAGGAAVSLYGVGGYATHSIDYKHKAFIHVPNSDVLLILAPEGTIFEKDSSGNPIFPVINPKYIGFNIMPAFGNHSLPENVAKAGTTHNIIPIDYGLSIESTVSQDKADETMGFYLTVYFAMLAIRLQKNGQFYIKGKK